LLLYGTGGLAYGNEKISENGFGTAAGCTAAVAIVCTSGSSTGVGMGWTAGGGVEYAVSRNWTVKAEYLYYDLGSRTLTLNDVFGRFPANVQTFTDAFRGNIVRGGVNYKF